MKSGIDFETANLLDKLVFKDQLKEREENAQVLQHLQKIPGFLELS